MSTTTESVEVIDRFDGEYKFLSNFYKGEPVVYKTLYDTAEHLYMSLKCADPVEAGWVASAPTPGEAKRRGQDVALRSNWHTGERLRAMRVTVGAKFLRDWHLQHKLLATGEAMLIEGNTWHDQFWGSCTCGREECEPEGENLLGWLLMEMRDDLQKWS